MFNSLYSYDENNLKKLKSHSFSVKKILKNVTETTEHLWKAGEPFRISLLKQQFKPLKKNLNLRTCNGRLLEALMNSEYQIHIHGKEPLVLEP